MIDCRNHVPDNQAARSLWHFDVLGTHVLSERDDRYTFCNRVSDFKYGAGIAPVQNRENSLAIAQACKITLGNFLSASDPNIMDGRKYINAHMQKLIADFLDNPAFRKIEEWRGEVNAA